MKKLLAALLITTATFAQSTTVAGVTLQYDQVYRSMELSIPQSMLTVNDSSIQVQVIIDKQYTLSISTGGALSATHDHYFIHQGHVYKDMWMFDTVRPSNCQVVQSNYVYRFTNVQPDEYVLQVNILYSKKHVSSQQSGSLVVR